MWNGLQKKRWEISECACNLHQDAILTSTFDKTKNVNPNEKMERMTMPQMRVSKGLRNDIIWDSSVGRGLANAR